MSVGNSYDVADSSVANK